LAVVSWFAAAAHYRKAMRGRRMACFRISLRAWRLSHVRMRFFRAQKESASRDDD
jgi:hypothetical protein